MYYNQELGLCIEFGPPPPGSNPPCAGSRRCGLLPGLLVIACYLSFTPSSLKYFVDLEVQISWQVQYSVDLEVQISWKCIGIYFEGALGNLIKKTTPQIDHVGSLVAV